MVKVNVTAVCGSFSDSTVTGETLFVEYSISCSSGKPCRFNNASSSVSKSRAGFGVSISGSFREILNRPSLPHERHPSCPEHSYNFDPPFVLFHESRHVEAQPSARLIGDFHLSVRKNASPVSRHNQRRDESQCGQQAGKLHKHHGTWSETAGQFFGALDRILICTDRYIRDCRQSPQRNRQEVSTAPIAPPLESLKAPY